jgi:hypothetical protein
MRGRTNEFGDGYLATKANGVTLNEVSRYCCCIHYDKRARATGYALSLNIGCNQLLVAGYSGSTQVTEACS